MSASETDWLEQVSGVCWFTDEERRQAAPRVSHRHLGLVSVLVLCYLLVHTQVAKAPCFLLDWVLMGLRNGKG